MNRPPAPAALALQASTQALLDLVQADRERQCAQILSEAQARADAVRTQARAEARRRLRSVFEEQRHQLNAHVAAAQARLATQQRLHAQQRTAALLGLAWQQLPAALQARWQQPEARAAWVAHVLATARARLPAEAWLIVHAADWPADEQAAASAALAAGGRAPPRFETDASLGAGLKVVAGGNVIDGTLPGLLADRAEVDAALLRHLETAS